MALWSPLSPVPQDRQSVFRVLALAQPATDPVIARVTEHLHQQDTQKAQGTTVDEGPGLRAPLKLEEVNEVLRGHGRKAAVGVSRGAGVSRVLRRRRGGGSGHIITLSQN